MGETRYKITDCGVASTPLMCTLCHTRALRIKEYAIDNDTEQVTFYYECECGAKIESTANVNDLDTEDK